MGGRDGCAGGGGPQLPQRPDVADLWPEVAEDRRMVTWAHAVNNRTLLRKALDDGTMMLEADLSLGQELGPDGPEPQPGQAVPIMAHPPAKQSDLSFAAFLEAVLAAPGRRGLKLDFKSTAVWEAAVPILQRADGRLRLPVWLNADIVRGPSGGPPAVDAAGFLSQCSEHFPGRTLSLGWSTGPLPPVSAAYTQQQVAEMMAAVASLPPSTPVTYAVRAAFASRSGPVLLPLLERPGTSFTLWGAATDKADEAGLLALAEAVGPRRLYVDLPSPPPGLLPGAVAGAAAPSPLLAAALAASAALALALPGL